MNKSKTKELQFKKVLGATQHTVLLFIANSEYTQINSEIHAHFLKLQYEENPNERLDAVGKKRLHSKVSYAATQLSEVGYLKKSKTKQGFFGYGITPLGYELLQAVVDGTVTIGKKYRPFTNKKKDNTPTPPPVYGKMNVSEATESMMDSLSEVIKENADYRALLLSVETLIATKLGTKTDG